MPGQGYRFLRLSSRVLQVFLSGLFFGELFRDENPEFSTLWKDLQKIARDKPTVMFFPGDYRHTLENGASLELFELLCDDKYYRAFNIYHYEI